MAGKSQGTMTKRCGLPLASTLSKANTRHWSRVQYPRDAMESGPCPKVLGPGGGVTSTRAAPTRQLREVPKATGDGSGWPGMVRIVAAHPMMTAAPTSVASARTTLARRVFLAERRDERWKIESLRIAGLKGRRTRRTAG